MIRFLMLELSRQKLSDLDPADNMSRGQIWVKKTGPNCPEISIIHVKSQLPIG
jgi:hypothetical protein